MSDPKPLFTQGRRCPDDKFRDSVVWRLKGDPRSALTLPRRKAARRKEASEPHRSRTGDSHHVL